MQVPDLIDILSLVGCETMRALRSHSDRGRPHEMLKVDLEGVASAA